ncbi:MAG: glutamate 5-kinase [Lentisphaeria bacterium]|nr:glutamate 5-kinase [Lentisphaeria bacterium]
MKKRICIKVGSNILTESNGRLNISRIAQLASQIKTLQDMGYFVCLISSGAVAAGRKLVKPQIALDVVSERQLYSALGQVHLINLYQRLFNEYDITCAQVLVTKHDFEDRVHYLNMKNIFTAFEQNKVVPIINENDTVAVTEMMFTDNDELAGLISSMINADSLIILTNVDGLYTGDPALPESSLIEVVESNKDDLSHVVVNNKSSFGRGGMHTKYRIATKTAHSGTSVYIANGNRDNILINLMTNQKVPNTYFQSSPQSKSEVQKWISYSEGYAKAEITLNQTATEALTSQNPNNLFTDGVTKIVGSFRGGDIIKIINHTGQQVAIASATLPSEVATKCIAKQQSKILAKYDYITLMEQ